MEKGELEEKPPLLPPPNEKPVLLSVMLGCVEPNETVFALAVEGGGAEG